MIWKVFNANGKMMASFRHPEDAVMYVIFLGEGAYVNFNHQKNRNWICPPDSSNVSCDHIAVYLWRKVDTENEKSRLRSLKKAEKVFKKTGVDFRKDYQKKEVT